MMHWCIMHDQRTGTVGLVSATFVGAEDDESEVMNVER
jgi:hypothetical protein